MKIAGRDGGRECVIVDILDDNYVLIDGNVRRRKCNIFHLESTPKKIDIKKGASHEDVKKEFSKLKIDVWETKAKEKKERPRKIRKKKVHEVKEGKTEKKKAKTAKKEEKKPTDASVIPVTKKESKTVKEEVVEKEK